MVARLPFLHINFSQFENLIPNKFVLLIVLQFVAQRKTYDDAKAHCESYNQKLMIIGSDTKMREIYQQMEIDNVTLIWFSICPDNYPVDKMNKVIFNEKFLGCRWNFSIPKKITPGLKSENKK